MSEYIPFINGSGDCKIAKKIFSDCELIRISLDSYSNISHMLPKSASLWVDLSIDGSHCLLNGKNRESNWINYIKSYTNSDILCDASKLNKIDQGVVKSFVFEIMDRALQLKPKWITLPQIPICDDTSRNKLNKILAIKSAEWRSERQFNGNLIFPLVFTHQNQTKGKTEWVKTLTNAQKWYNLSGANGLWTVDSSLNDEDCSKGIANRLKQLIDFSVALNETFSSTPIKVTGPYWGFNLVLWARGLFNHPAISLGSAYQYYLSGGFIKQGKARIALTPLRRRAIADPGLKGWLEYSLTKISQNDLAYKEFLTLTKDYELISLEYSSKEQVAKFYREWINKIESIPIEGRSLYLYQDFSSAYILGKQIDQNLPDSEKSARLPEKIAQQLMLTCL